MINYKALLKRYMEHVAGCEGTNFITDYSCGFSSLSDEEFEALKAVAMELSDGDKPMTAKECLEAPDKLKQSFYNSMKCNAIGEK